MPIPRHAVFVDAGYLLAAGGWATLGAARRADAHVALADLVGWLQAEAAATLPGSELLRLYWYDGAPRREPGPDHQAIARLPDTKLRLGSLNTQGVQKGVDALLIADMLDLAHGRSIDSAVLVTGDEDTLEAVDRVQSSGVRLHLWGIETPKNTVSGELRRAADRLRLLRADELRPFFTAKLAPRPAPKPPAASPLPPANRPAWLDAPLPTPHVAGVTLDGAPLRTYAEVDRSDALAAGRSVAREILAAATAAQREFLERDRPSIPYQMDARLLIRGAEVLGTDQGDLLDEEARWSLRVGFWEEVDATGAAIPPDHPQPA